MINSNEALLVLPRVLKLVRVRAVISSWGGLLVASPKALGLGLIHIFHG